MKTASTSSLFPLDLKQLPDTLRRLRQFGKINLIIVISTSTGKDIGRRKTSNMTKLVHQHFRSFDPISGWCFMVISYGRKSLDIPKLLRNELKG